MLLGLSLLSDNVLIKLCSVVVWKMLICLLLWCGRLMWCLCRFFGCVRLVFGNVMIVCVLLI